MKSYFHPVVPENYPLFDKRNALAVTRKQLGDRVRFVSLRSFDMDNDNNLINIDETIDLYTKEFKLCDVIWPVYPTLFAPNFGELVAEVKKRDMFLFDFWGYVPGSNPDKTNMWGEYTPPQSAVTLLEGLGDHFIGFDNGEQDGRYIGSFAPLMCPASGNRMSLYKNFCRHFEKLEAHMQNNISLLASLHFLHYFAKGGNTILLGAETAQALPNANVWFSYIRGAGKQYGLLWFGNVSVWNRWGWKDFNRISGVGTNEEGGPEMGTSLSLLKRMLYTEYMYNSDLLGFEGGWILGKEHLLDEKFLKQGETHQLSPVGIIQENMTEFVKKHPTPGIMHTPLCLYMDFYNGFAPPRHLYSKQICRVWGNRSYEDGDFQVHALFSMLYPSYENAGFFHDEEGFLTATPYGDIADVIFSDTECAVLDYYSTILVCGDGALDLQSQDKLLSSAKSGNTVVMFSNKLSGVGCEFLEACGISSLCEAKTVVDTICLNDNSHSKEIFSQDEFLLSCCNLCDTDSVEIIAKTGSGKPAIISSRIGEGKLITILLPSGLVTQKDGCYSPQNPEDKSLTIPYKLHPAISNYLGYLFDELAILKVDNKALQYSVNKLSSDTMTMLICNNTPNVEAFSIIGKGVKAVSEWEISDITPEYTGYLPKSEYINNDSKPCKNDGEFLISPFAVRILEVAVSSDIVKEKPSIKFEKPKHAPITIALPEGKTIRDFYWELPWFDSYFSGVKIDARYLERLSGDFLEKEGEFVRLHKLDVIVDFSSMLNHYPDFSLIRNIPGRTEESISRIEKILKKASSCGCTKAIFTAHRTAENAITTEQACANMKQSLHEIAELAKQLCITAYFENGRSLERTVFAKCDDAYSIAGDEYKHVYSLSHGIGAGENPADCVKANNVSGVFLSAPIKDCFGQYSDIHQPISVSPLEAVAMQAKEICKNAEFICLDAYYESNDEIYSDLKLIL